MRIKASDLVGKEYKNFKILDCKRENKRTYLLVVCPFCHKKKWMRKDTIDKPEVISCGCYNRDKNFKKLQDISGERFGRLTAIYPTEKRDKSNGAVIWICKCDCGNYKEAAYSVLISGGVKSCGCLGKENSVKNGKIAGDNVAKVHCVQNTNIKNLTSKIPKNNTSGIKGVTWCKDRNKWAAQIGFKGKNYHLGRYDKKEDAAKIRRIAEENLFTSFLDWYAENYPEQWRKMQKKKNKDK